MNKVLVTGGSGFIGRQVINILLELEYNVHAVIFSQELPPHPMLTQHRINLFDKVTCEAFMKKNEFSHCIHLAWYTGEKCHSSLVNVDWAQVSFDLLRFFHKYGGRRIVMGGSVSEYDFSYGVCREGFTPLTPPSLYGKCKAGVYHISEEYCRAVGLSFGWARIFNLYGPYEKQNRLVPAVILSILNENPVRVSPCTKYQDYLCVYDAAKAITDFFRSSIEGAVNICSGAPVQLRSIVGEIATQLQYDGEIEWGAIPESFDAKIVVGSNDRLISEVGWTQKFSLRKGLCVTIEWWKNNFSI